MFFTQAGLQEFLSQIFFKVPSTPLVVPLQGNFRNPQDGADDIEPRVWLTKAQLLDPKGNMKPDTWIGFRKKTTSPRVQSFLRTDPETGITYSCVFSNSDCWLQIVGAQSEEWAESLKHWMQRSDVTERLADMDAQLYADGLGRIEISTFVQDGMNSILAYNVFFSVQWASTIDVADQSLITGAEFTGTVAVLN